MIVKKVLKFIVTGVMILCITLLITMGVSSRMNGGTPIILGSQLMVVLSGSMVPTFNTGSIVAVKPVQLNDIKVRDIITFKDNDGKIVTHRVVKIEDGKLVTKGDANDSADSGRVTSDRIIGRVKLWIPYIGYFIEFTKSKVGLLLLLVVPGLFLVITQLWKLFMLMTGEDKKDDTKVKV